MRARWIRKTRKNEMGQSLVEFALVVPLLLLLVIGIAEFGRAWMTQNILTGAAREAARFAAVPPPYGSHAIAVTRANTILDSAGIPPSPTNRTVTVIIPPGVFGQDVTATVTYNFPVVIAGFIPGLGNIQLRSTTTMRKEFSDPVAP